MQAKLIYRFDKWVYHKTSDNNGIKKKHMHIQHNNNNNKNNKIIKIMTYKIVGKFAEQRLVHSQGQNSSS